MSTAEGRAYIRTTEFKSLKDRVYYFFLREHDPSMGWTTPEMVRAINMAEASEVTYSNPVSGALSRLHNKDMKIIRLKEKRAGFNIYVLPEYVNGRDYYEPRAPRRPGGGWVVTDEKVRRGLDAWHNSSGLSTDHMRAALEAALNPEGED
jgi:hypothetical protein